MSERKLVLGAWIARVVAGACPQKLAGIREFFIRFGQSRYVKGIVQQGRLAVHGGVRGREPISAPSYSIDDR
jgi:hypothetical protein